MKATCKSICFTPSCTICFILSFMFLTFCTNAKDEIQNSFSATQKSMNNFVPVRYVRSIFVFLSNDTTKAFFADVILKKLVELDNFCSGENFGVLVVFGNGSNVIHQPPGFWTLETHFSSVFGNPETYLNASIANNVSAGSIDFEDVNNVSATLLKFAPDIFWVNKYYTAKFTFQIILVTNYVTKSLKSDNTNLALAALADKDVTFIALTANISDSRAKEYFRNDIWTIVNTNYTQWTPENETTDPICNNQQITTPNPSFGHIDITLYIMLLFSPDYIKTTQLREVIDLLTNMTVRRWLYPCEQYNSVQYDFFSPDPNTPDLLKELDHCYVEETNLENRNDKRENTNLQGALFCSYNNLNYIFGEKGGVGAVNETLPNVCRSEGIYDTLFDGLLFLLKQLSENKILLITDLPMLCSNQISSVSEYLTNYTDFTSGAPLTVIAIDKEHDDSVSRSYENMFPATQKPNLYKVNSVADLLPNINTTINFCLNFVPLLPVTTLPYYKEVWYYYVIGALILIALIIFFVFLAIRRQRKRHDDLRQLSEGMQITTISTTNNHYENVPESLMPADVWEISLQSLDINFKKFIGNGAFSVVHSGFLHGKAPVLNIFPSIALQQFSDCNVAVKTLPQHRIDIDKRKFCDEIDLMKEIGYHIHLVSMLGCNCSIERPILVMELAEQDLLHWLISNERETETSLEKTLISTSWQISDGMSYLSSNLFIHRDLAARNVLLNAEMKAMIGDFGLCRKIDHSEEVLVDSGGKLPLKWLSLESLQEEKFSLKTDSWSFGILLFEIFTLGQEPYKDIPNEELISFLLEGNRLNKPENMNDEMYDLMRRCWQSDPSERPDFFTIGAFFAAVLEDMTLKYGYLPTI